MSIIGSNLLAGASGQGGYTIEESLRFNASQSSYLSRTLASSGTTATYSAWVKRGTLGTASTFFGTTDASTYDFQITFTAANTIEFYAYRSSAQVFDLVTTQVFRDPSAWYHIVAVLNTPDATAANRVQLFVNGSRVTSFSTAAYPAQNATTPLADSRVFGIGNRGNVNNNYFDGYLTEVNFIDGQALDASSFGEFDSVTGVWKPVGYTGTYGTNGFYLPMKLDNTTEGFNTVTWVGTGTPQKISGVGFSPDLVWGKSRTNVRNHNLYDSVRGAGNMLLTNGTNAELTGGELTGFTSDGFTLGSNVYQLNASGDSMVAWCWDAGDTTVSNDAGSITSSVRANTAYGFSVVTYNQSSTFVTVGHGLNVKPAMIIYKSRTGGDNWVVWHKGLANETTYALQLNTTTDQFSATSLFNSTAPTSSVFTSGTGINTLNTDVVAYCFSEVSGYSKFGSYTGTGATGNAVTTGFKPAFVMIKRTDLGDSWALFDSTRDSVNPVDTLLYAERSDAEGVNTFGAIDFTDTGFTVNGIGSTVNNSGGTYIYMAFADTREYAFWLDDSGNNNDWQPNGGITTSSTVTDTPTPYADGGNYAVLNPLHKSANATLSDGNLKIRSAVTGANNFSIATVTLPTDKVYFEVTAGNNTGAVVVCEIGLVVPTTQTFAGTNSGIQCVNGGLNKIVNGVYTSIGGGLTTGTVLGFAYDLINGLMTIYRDGSAVATDETIPTTFRAVLASVYRDTANDVGWEFNFGQRPFAYTPPTGFKSLHTGNLPDSAIVDGSEYFEATTYVGDGNTTQTISGLEFQTDFAWVKRRSYAASHVLQDAVRTFAGSTKLSSNSTNAEGAAGATAEAEGYVSGASSTGFTVTKGTGQQVNENGATYVAWNWKANGAGVSNTDGSITSTVSANPTAGFSIATFTAQSSGTGTFGHGLGIAPSMVILKQRSAGTWPVYHASIGNGNYLILNTTAGQVATTTYWNSTSPSSTVFTLGTAWATAGDMVAYCFADVDGYSKFGSYTGNGSSDGVFVHLGFRARYLLIKETGNANSWEVYDTARNSANVQTQRLFPNDSQAEATTNPSLDILSNGFKCRAGNTGINRSGGNYIYMAFAENPFKNSLAR